MTELETAVFCCGILMLYSKTHVTNVIAVSLRLFWRQNFLLLTAELATCWRVPPSFFGNVHIGAKAG